MISPSPLFLRTERPQKKDRRRSSLSAVLSVHIQFARGPYTPGMQFRDFTRERERRFRVCSCTAIYTSPTPPVCVVLVCAPCFSVLVHCAFLRYSLVVIRGCLIFRSCFVVVTPLAEGLPVATIPEELLVSSVRFYMIDHSCRRDPSCSQALHAERM